MNVVAAGQGNLFKQFIRAENTVNTYYLMNYIYTLKIYTLIMTFLFYLYKLNM